MKEVPACLIAVLILSLILPVKASVTTSVSVDDSLFITYNFENLDPAVYEQTKTNPQFNITTIPQAITENLEQKDRKLVTWWLGPQTNLLYDDANHTIQASFFLGGSDIIGFTINKTTMKRTYEVDTQWREFQVSLTSNFSIDFTQLLSTPLAEWQKNATTFYYENKQTGTLDVFFYLALPTAASNVQAQGDTVSYEMPPRFEDQLLDSPFIILIALAVALIIVLAYRKAR